MKDSVEFLGAQAVILGKGGSGAAVLAHAHRPGILCIRLQVVVLCQKLAVGGLELVVLLLGDQHRTAHDRFRAVPLRLHGQEILPCLLATLVALDHAQLFGHRDGELVVINCAADHPPALILNPVNFDRVEIFALSKAVLTHTGEPVTIICADFQEVVQLTAAHGGALRVVVVDRDKVAHAFASSSTISAVTGTRK